MVDPIPAILDARHGAVDHPCPGTWEYLGLGSTGHEIYSCSSEHRLISREGVPADHTCTADCAQALTAGEAEAIEGEPELRQLPRRFPGHAAPAEYRSILATVRRDAQAIMHHGERSLLLSPSKVTNSRAIWAQDAEPRNAPGQAENITGLPPAITPARREAAEQAMRQLGQELQANAETIGALMDAAAGQQAQEPGSDEGSSDASEPNDQHHAAELEL
jgi:hypothetical protein